LRVGDAADALGQEMRAKSIADGLAHEPEPVLGQPAVGRLGLVQPQDLPDKVAEAVEELALEGLLGRFSHLRRVAAEFLGDGGSVGLNDELAENSGVLVLAGENVEESSPEVRIAAQPVEDLRV
jgi:hypothetical protein